MKSCPFFNHLHYSLTQVREMKIYKIKAKHNSILLEQKTCIFQIQLLTNLIWF